MRFVVISGQPKNICILNVKRIIRVFNLYYFHICAVSQEERVQSRSNFNLIVKTHSCCRKRNNKKKKLHDFCIRTNANFYCRVLQKLNVLRHPYISTIFLALFIYNESIKIRSRHLYQYKKNLQENICKIKLHGSEIPFKYKYILLIFSDAQCIETLCKQIKACLKDNECILVIIIIFYLESKL